MELMWCYEDHTGSKMTTPVLDCVLKIIDPVNGVRDEILRDDDSDPNTQAEKTIEMFVDILLQLEAIQQNEVDDYVDALKAELGVT
jgi:hypothetical protein